MCGNLGFVSKEICKKLDKKTIQNGGLENIEMPIAIIRQHDDSDNKILEVGGYRSLVHYNKQREEDSKIERENKTFRRLKKNIRNKKLRQSGETVAITQIGVMGETF